VKIKTDWQEWVHPLRSRAFHTAFNVFPENAFSHGLELGAGDGFQTNLLSGYVRHLISTDYYNSILNNQDTDAISYQQCDAEKVGEIYGDKQFDLIFSSNLLEHLPRPDIALGGMHKILKDDGILVHSIPTPFMKFSFLFFHYPNLVVTLIETLTEKKSLMDEVHPAPMISSGENPESESAPCGNNPKTDRKARSLLHRILVKRPHGVSETNIQEFFAFSKKRWIREFDNAGFELLAVLKGPAASGYAFGMNRLRKVVEKLGFSSEYIYVAKKKNMVSAYEEYF